MNVNIKTKGHYDTYNFNASIDMLKYIETLNSNKDIKCEHKNLGSDRHYMEVICETKEIYEQLKNKSNPNKLLEYAAVMTLNGNLILKEQSKVKETDEVEIELYGVTIEDIKKQFNDHKKELKNLDKDLESATTNLRAIIAAENPIQKLEQ